MVSLTSRHLPLEVLMLVIIRGLQNGIYSDPLSVKVNAFTFSFLDDEFADL
jgi:hypothetical protein